MKGLTTRVRILLAMVMFMSIAFWGFAPAEDSGAEEIRWNANRRLTWKDFKGRPDRVSRMDALTESGISFSWSCDWRGFQVETYAMMVPPKSWVKDKSNYLLSHEQAHFDITEIHARKLRKYFAERKDPCSMGKNAINQAAERIIKATFKMQNVYDSETEHASDEREQARWVLKIASELNALKNWAE